MYKNRQNSLTKTNLLKHTHKEIYSQTIFFFKVQILEYGYMPWTSIG